jgi:hypothetical protein
MENSNNYLKELIEEVCEQLDTSYTFEDDVYTLTIETEDGSTEEVSIYETVDSYDVPKIDCTISIGPIIKNTDLLYTFLKSNFELEYGSYAIINEDDMDVLILIESIIADSAIADDLVAIILYLIDVAHETRELLSKHS